MEFSYRILVLMLPFAATGCVFPAFYNIPIAAHDPFWDNRGTVTEVDGRSITVDGKTTEIAGLDISMMDSQ